MARQKIKLARGEEVEINGFIIRATGLDPKRPNSLNLYHPNMLNPVEAHHDPLKSLYAGIAGNVVCATSLSVGLVGDLATAEGWTDAIATAKQWIKDHLPYFACSDRIRQRAEEAAKSAV